jgi:hypothetical protein
MLNCNTFPSAYQASYPLLYETIASQVSQSTLIVGGPGARGIIVHYTPEVPIDFLLWKRRAFVVTMFMRYSIPVIRRVSVTGNVHDLI